MGWLAPIDGRGSRLAVLGSGGQGKVELQLALGFTRI